MSIQALPPKMAQQFAERARCGDYSNFVGSNIYEFFQGNQVICIIGLNNPVGHIQKISTDEMKQRRSSAKRKEEDL